MVTLNDVARVANVSASTVSHVINKTRRVNPETERVVRAAIESTGYAGDGIARSLRKGRTDTLGLAMSAISNPYFGEVVHAIERSATAEDYSLLLAETHDDPERELRAVRDLLSHRVDGVIMAPSNDPGAALALIERRGIPVVLIDRVPVEDRPHTDAIGVSNREPVAQLVTHLVEHGHTRIAMLAPQPGVATTEERVEGFLTGLRRNGIDPQPGLLELGCHNSDALEGALSRVLGLDDPPTALVLGNNQVTIGAMADLHLRGLVPPAGIATVSFDDFPWADSFHPRITTMSQPTDDLGVGAVSLLLDRLADSSLAPRQRRLDPEFVVRESCGCVR